jgi:hypothetical protein
MLSEMLTDNLLDDRGDVLEELLPQGCRESWPDGGGSL